MDLTVEVFDDSARAIAYARDFMRSHVAYPEKLEEIGIAGHIWFQTYEPESDYAFVIRRNINYRI